MPDFAGDSCTRCPQLRLLRFPERGGVPVCSKIKAQPRPRRRRRAHRPMVWGPVPGSWLSPNPSSLGPAAAGHTTVPAPGASATESSAGANPWHPSAIVRETASISLTPITNPSLTLSDEITQLPYNFTHASAHFTLGFGLGRWAQLGITRAGSAAFWLPVGSVSGAETLLPGACTRISSFGRPGLAEIRVNLAAISLHQPSACPRRGGYYRHPVVP